MAQMELDGVGKTFTVRARAGRLRRVKRQVDAVADVSLSVEAGEAVGYVGPNGAGKSTTIKMLTGILVPSRGRVRVVGFDPARSRVDVVRRLGVVFGQRTQLWWDLPLRDSFDLLRHVYRVAPARHARTLDDLVALLELAPLLDTPVRALSLGQRMRGELAASLLHEPEILLLDEPTIGLDVVAKATVRDVLRRLNAERGVTILLTTHDLADVERLCPRMVILDRGRLLYDGDVEALRDRYGGERTLVVDLEEPAAPLAVPGTCGVEVDGARQYLRFRRREVTAADLIASVASRARLVDLAVVEPDIEGVVARIYRET